MKIDTPGPMPTGPMLLTACLSIHTVAGLAAGAVFLATLTVAAAVLKFQRKAPVAPFKELDENKRQPPMQEPK